MPIYDSVLRTIGRTPVIRINRLAPAGIKMYVKMESRNPAASVKDRLALALIEDAERTGALKPGQTVIEATSGNTGIALAMVCAAKGYPFVATMVETVRRAATCLLCRRSRDQRTTAAPCSDRRPSCLKHLFLLLRCSSPSSAAS